MKKPLEYNFAKVLAVIIIIFGMSFACQDNFDNTINKENNENDVIHDTDEDPGDGTNPGTGWTKKAYIGTPRAGAAAIIVNHCLYIYGGENDLGMLGDFWKYDLTSGNCKFLDLTNSGSPVAYADFVEAEGILYIFGGKDSAGNPTRNLKRYNISNALFAKDTWLSEIIGPNEFNGSPETIFSHVTLTYDKTIIIHGGFGDKDGLLYEISEPLADFQVPAKKPDWKEFDKNKIELKLAEHAAAIYNDKIYIFGGINTEDSKYKNDLYEYDLLKAISSTSATSPLRILKSGSDISARSSIQMIVVKSGIYVYGGQNESGCLNDLCSYSFDEQKWVTVSIGPANLCHYNALKYTNNTGQAYLLIYGGYNSKEKSYNSELWQYPID